MCIPHPPPSPVLTEAESRGSIQGSGDMTLPFTEPRSEGEIYPLTGGLGIIVTNVHGPQGE